MIAIRGFVVDIVKSLSLISSLHEAYGLLGIAAFSTCIFQIDSVMS